MGRCISNIDVWRIDAVRSPLYTELKYKSQTRNQEFAIRKYAPGRSTKTNYEDCAFEMHRRRYGSGPDLTAIYISQGSRRRDVGYTPSSYLEYSA